MALQVNAPLVGGVTHENAYVRVQAARVFKNAKSDGYSLMIDAEIYASKDERDKVDAVQLACREMDMHKFPFSIGDEKSNLIELAYTKLKTLSVYDGATDV